MGKKIQKTVTLDPEILKWVEKQIEFKRFASLSHAIDYALQELKKSDAT